MNRLVALVSLSVACAGTSQAPRPPSPAKPSAACPACPDRECPASPEVTPPTCPTLPSPYPDTQTWHCIDDPARNQRKLSYSYCWSTLAHCTVAHEIYVKERSTVKPCRPQAPVYCFHMDSDLSRSRLYYCAATPEQCEYFREDEQKRTKPEHAFTFSSCTRHP